MAVVTQSVWLDVIVFNVVSMVVSASFSYELAVDEIATVMIKAVFAFLF